MADFLKVDDDNYLNLELIEWPDESKRAVYIGGLCYRDFNDCIYEKIQKYVRRNEFYN